LKDVKETCVMNKRVSFGSPHWMKQH